MSKLISLLNKIKGKSILVIGDIMLDKYIFGEVCRISPEAPVQIVRVVKENYVPGGAANVANNVSSLNGKASIIGLVGEDNSKNKLIAELKKRKITTDGIITDKKRPTIEKIRILGHNQQLLRVDYEKKHYIELNMENKILSYVKKNIKKIDGVVVSDYAKGIVTKKTMEVLVDICKQNNKVLVIDPKPKHSEYYNNATLITPNNKEACEMAGMEEKNDDEIIKVGKKLVSDLNTDILITRGEKGMSLFEKTGKVTNIPTKAREVYDVTGAGDTVVATLTMALAAGASKLEAAMLANHAAGIVVGKIGTSPVTLAELKKSIENE